MAPVTTLGEFEQLLLLAVLRLDADAYGASIAHELEATAGLLRWAAAKGTPARNGLPRRLYTVTPGGIAALRGSRETLRRMWRGVEHLLKDSAS